jgi:hypothetical protein
MKLAKHKKRRHLKTYCDETTNPNNPFEEG